MKTALFSRRERTTAKPQELVQCSFEPLRNEARTSERVRSRSLGIALPPPGWWSQPPVESPAPLTAEGKRIGRSTVPSSLMSE
jgi:hypothetical protein